MRIAIIGATGHIGSWLVPRLIRAGHDVTTVSRGSSRPYHDAPEWRDTRSVVIDRTARELDGTFGKTIADLNADVVVDLICFELSSAKHLTSALRDNIEHFIHCGTLWVHGVPTTRPYRETASRAPFGDYGIKKAAIESFLMNASLDGFPATVLHPGHITGPGWIPINPAGNLDIGVFEKLWTGARVALPDDGMSTLQHVHVDDVAQAFELTIDRREASIGEAFHVAAAEPVTLIDYAEAVAGWSGRSANLTFSAWEEWQHTVSERDAKLTRDHMLHSPHASIEKARQILGYAPAYTATEAARDAVNSLLPGKHSSMGDSLHHS